MDLENEHSWIRLVGANPGAGATIELEMPRGGAVDLGIYDAAGRLIARPLDRQTLDVGLHRVAWNGEDASGRRVAPGVYFVRVERGDQMWSRRITVLRR
ncbi:MAG TPA: FlgD immunoglobulin-like domain containing protein [Candidatus Eisenbacteria bacterium]|nr:FlgD immunoglobulin-like domain containing protein [Candidatus Eisenbacteria bacterium]